MGGDRHAAPAAPLHFGDESHRHPFAVALSGRVPATLHGNGERYQPISAVRPGGRRPSGHLSPQLHLHASLSRHLLSAMRTLEERKTHVWFSAHQERLEAVYMEEAGVHDGHSEEQSLRPVHHGQLLPLWKGQKQGTLDESIITHRTVDMQRSLEENPCCGCTP